MVTENWVLSVWDAMKNVVTMILIKPFQILDSIPLGFADASVMDFILGIGIIGIAIFFFWRSATGREKFAEKVYTTSRPGRGTYTRTVRRLK